MRPADQARVDAAVAIFREFNWTEMSATPRVVSRVPFSGNPILNNGKSGGKLVETGGRLRFEFPGKLRGGARRATVGPRTVAFYRCAQGGPRDFEQISTKDTVAISARLAGMAREASV